MFFLIIFFCFVVMNFYVVYFRCKGCLFYRMRRRVWIWALCVRYILSFLRIWLIVAILLVSLVVVVITESSSLRNILVYLKRLLYFYIY